MKKIHSGTSGIIMSIIELAIGILLLINPEGFTKGIIIALGIVMAGLGVWQIIGYFRTEAEEAAQKGTLTTGILLTVFGLFCALNSGWFITTFTVITVLYGALILATGVSKLQAAVDMVRAKQKYWFVALIGALLTLVFAVLILMNPFSSTFLWIFIGISLIVEAVMDVITFIFARKQPPDTIAQTETAESEPAEV